MIKLASWNINGLRAVHSKGELTNFLARFKPDILALQEIKIKPEQINFGFDGYQMITNSAQRAGYSGTAFLIKQELANQLDLANAVQRNLPDDIADKYKLAADKFGDVNSEGRVTTLDVGKFFLVAVYTPNSKGDLSRLDLRFNGWDPAFLEYINRLRDTKPVVFCGDLNVAANEIDLANPAGNRGKHGFTDQERKRFADYINNGLIDSFRFINGDIKDCYSWWSPFAKSRQRNIGWRIDYFMVDDQLSDVITGATIESDQMGSDHCPVTVNLEV